MKQQIEADKRARAEKAAAEKACVTLIHAEVRSRPEACPSATQQTRRSTHACRKCRCWPFDRPAGRQGRPLGVVLQLCSDAAAVSAFVWKPYCVHFRERPEPGRCCRLARATASGGRCGRAKGTRQILECVVPLLQLPRVDLTGTCSHLPAQTVHAGSNDAEPAGARPGASLGPRGVLMRVAIFCIATSGHSIRDLTMSQRPRLRHRQGRARAYLQGGTHSSIAILTPGAGLVGASNSAPSIISSIRRSCAVSS